MGQRGFWDEQQRVTKLQDKKPVLKHLADSIPWESFRPLLEKGYEHERKSNAGRKRIDPLILFKMLVLQQLFNLIDEEHVHGWKADTKDWARKERCLAGPQEPDIQLPWLSPALLSHGSGCMKLA